MSRQLRPRPTLKAPSRYSAHQVVNILWDDIEDGDCSDDPGFDSQDDGEIENGKHF